MKVKQLIEILQEFNPEFDIYVQLTEDEDVEITEVELLEETQEVIIQTE